MWVRSWPNKINVLVRTIHCGGGGGERKGGGKLVVGRIWAVSEPCSMQMMCCWVDTWNVYGFIDQGQPNRLKNNNNKTPELAQSLSLSSPFSCPCPLSCSPHCEDTVRMLPWLQAGRTLWPETSSGKPPPGTSSPQNCEKVNFCCLSPHSQVSCTVSWYVSLIS